MNNTIRESGFVMFRVRRIPKITAITAAMMMMDTTPVFATMMKSLVVETLSSAFRRARCFISAKVSTVALLALACSPPLTSA